MTAETVAAPALGYSILANLGDEKQLTIQCFADSEEPLESIHAKIDRALAVVDRQKARYKIKDLEKEVVDMEGALARSEDDLNSLEAKFVAEQQALDERIVKSQGAIEQLNAEAYGRGRAKPVGQEGAQVNAHKREIESLTEQKGKAAAERDQARHNLAISIGRFHDAIAERNKQIDECRALVDGS